MDKLNVSNLNFAINNKDVPNLKFAKDEYKIIYRLIYKYPNQREIHLVLDRQPNEAGYESAIQLDEEYRKLIRDFGFLAQTDILKIEKEYNTRLSLEDKEGMVNRKYVLILPKLEVLNKENFNIAIDKFMEDNLPEGAAPVYYFDENEYKTPEEFVYYRNLMLERFPNIELHNNFSTLFAQAESKAKQERDLRKAIEDIEDRDIIDITTELDSIYNTFSTNNQGTHLKFLELMESIVERDKGNTLVLYKGANTEANTYIAAYLKYFHNIECYVPGRDTDSYMTVLSNMYYNPSTMLVEERIKYLLNFPTFTFRGVTVGYGICYLATSSTTVTAKCYTCDLPVLLNCPIDQMVVDRDIIPNLVASNINVINDLNFRNVKFVPLLDLFHLNSPDNNIRAIDSKLLAQVIVHFEKALAGHSVKLINLLDIFFIENAGSITLCYLDKLDFSTQSVLISDMFFEENINSKKRKMDNAIIPNYSLTTDTVGGFLPIEVLDDYKEVLTKIYWAVPVFAPAKLQKVLRRVNDDAIITIPKRRPLRLTSKYYAPMQLFYMNKDKINLLGFISNEEYYLGMYSPYCVGCRSKGFKELLGGINLDYIRANDIINLFGSVGLHSNVLKELDSNYIVGGI